MATVLAKYAWYALGELLGKLPDFPCGQVLELDVEGSCEWLSQEVRAAWVFPTLLHDSVSPDITSDLSSCVPTCPALDLCGLQGAGWGSETGDQNHRGLVALMSTQGTWEKQIF